MFDRPIGKNQAIAHPLADSWIRLEAAEMMSRQGGAAVTMPSNVRPEANAAKYLGSEAGFEACDRAMQTLGGFSYAKEYHVERFWRESRLLKIAPVSQEMVLNYISTRSWACRSRTERKISTMREAVICEPLRTPVGGYGGAAQGCDGRSDLAATVLDGAAAAHGDREAEDIDDVMFGQSIRTARRRRSGVSRRWMPGSTSRCLACRSTAAAGPGCKR